MEETGNRGRTMSFKKVPREKLNMASDGIREARAFFKAQGAQTDKEGLMTRRLEPELVQTLKSWHDATRGEFEGGGFGVDMPTITDFYRKVYLAVSLWRQYESERAPYLLGKGVGVEIALRGVVRGRIKNPFEFSYRTHSDFEFYAVNYISDGAGGNISKEGVYPDNFWQIFGGQEYFPPTKTKGLVRLPPDLLVDTADEVDFGGIPIKIPNLEILFLDKYLMAGVMNRQEGTDAEVLAHQYQLDAEKVMALLEDHVITPATEDTRAEMREYPQRQFRAIKRMIGYAFAALDDAGIRPDALQVVRAVNDKRELMQKILMTGPGDFSHGGVDVRHWPVLSGEDFGADGEIREARLLAMFEENAVEKAGKASEQFEQIRKDITELLERSSRIRESI